MARDLKDSQAKDLSDDWRLAIAYNAALQAATAALAAAGYRASRDSHHYRVIQSPESADVDELGRHHHGTYVDDSAGQSNPLQR